MTLRLSTQSLYLQGLNSLLGRQGEIARLQQQINSGIKLTRKLTPPAIEVANENTSAGT